MAPSLTRKEVVSAQLSGDYSIKSEKASPKLDTSEWPLLLKNYDKLLVRSSHFTPIPTGCSPLKRDITTYIKYAISSIFIFDLDLLLDLVLLILINLPIPPRTKSLPGSVGYSV